MAQYKENYPMGSMVQIADSQRLKDFLGTWKSHHPISHEQLDHAGRIAVVERVSFYHGGDVLYELTGVPGIWHEQCLESSSL